MILFLAKISSLSVLVPLIVKIFAGKKLNKSVRFFWYYILLCSFTEVALLVHSLLKMPNHYLFNSFAPIEVSMLTIFFSLANKDERRSKLLLWAIPLFMIPWLYYAIEGSFFLLSENIYLIESFLMISMALYSLFILIKGDANFQLYREPLFWLYTGIFVYFISTAAIYGLSSFLINSRNNQQIFVVVNSFTNILTNLAYTIGFLCPVLKSR